ncbi:MAG: phosphomannomutase/phosphoglucomutase [Gammaproteobacteria bacterium]|jgi:phosphomannomutase/phosphoglucomutase
MVEGPVSNRRFSRRAVRQAITISVIVLVIFVVAGGGWTLFSKISADAAKAESEAKEKMARDIAAHVQKNVTGIKDKLSALAKDQTTISLFVESTDTETLSLAADAKQALFDNALKLRFLKPRSYEADSSAVPPLSYASIEMLSKAETSNQVNAEAHLFGTPNQHVVFIERVVNDSFEVVGLIHLSLDVEVFKTFAEGLVVNDGYAELIQRGAGKEMALNSFGNNAFKNGEATTVSVNDTRWIIAYWTGTAVAATDSASSGLPVMPIAIVIILLILVGAFFVMKKRNASVAPSNKDSEDDLITYEGVVRAIAEGAHGGVEHMIPHLPKGDRIAANLKPLSQGLTGDDVTMIAKPQKAKPEAVAEESPSVIGANDDTPPAGTDVPDLPAKEEVSPVIFRTYDIRGIVEDVLTESAVEQIGKALGTMAHEQGQQGIVVARDGRLSSPMLGDALIKGLRSTGRDVIDIGLVPTPVLYFATYHLETGSGVMITGSHNAPEYNGLKMMLAGNTLSGDDIAEIQKRVASGEFTTGQGDLRHADIAADYVRRISEDIPVALGSSLKVVVDCGNGAAGTLAPQLLNAIGHDVIEMYCDIDGSFPNHHPDPSQPENLQELIEKVKAEGADVGFAFDGDGDRLGIVDAEGNIIWPDRQLMLLAKDVLSRNQGAPIIFDVKCSRYLKSIIESSGGEPLMWKTGHSLIKSKMKEVDAPLAGEMSGHIFFKERWYGFDDALYTAARFIEIFTNSKTSPTELFAELPEGTSTPELRLPLEEGQHSGFMKELAGKLSSDNAEVIDIDGVRIEYTDGWGLARPSNTSPYIVLRFEGESDAVLERIKAQFRDAIKQVLPDVDVPF